MSPVRLPVRLLLGGAVLLGGSVAMPLTVFAQTAPQARVVPVVSQPVVQSVPGGEGMKLNDALSRINTDPRDIPALLDAGKASLDLGDVDAAIGFFKRASTLSPGNAQAKAGLAGAYVLKRDPFTAIPLFSEAEKAGPIDPARLSDRGLAYDLVGDNQTAQRYYRESLAAAPSDETLRRLALSQAISGDRRGMETTLSPLLQKQDKAAWRTRAFALAILGYGDEAEGIAQQSLPADRASAISAYLRFMPRLTPAQQAAAGTLGHFPRAAEVGVDDPRVAQFARPRSALAVAAPAATPPAAAKAKTKPRSAATASTPPAKPQQQTAAPVAPPEPKVGREVNGEPVQLAVVSEPAPKPTAQAQLAAVTAQPSAHSSVQTAVQSVVQPVAPAPAPKVAVAAPQAVVPGFATLDPAQANPAPGFDLKQVSAAPNSPAPAHVSPPVQPASQRQPATPAQGAPRSKPARFEDAFAEFGAPSAEAAPTSGAVDVRKIASPPAASKAAAAKDAPAKDTAAKEAKGKQAAKLDECAEPPAKGKAGAKGKADTKGKAAVKSGTKAGSAGATQCKDGKLVKTPSHPSRIWVQVATGKSKKALAFDWNRFATDDPAVFKSRKGYTSAWGQTNRLLTGPFDSEAAASAYIARLRKAGIGDAFVWTSPAGQVVDVLP